MILFTLKKWFYFKNQPELFIAVNACQINMIQKASDILKIEIGNHLSRNKK